MRTKMPKFHAHGCCSCGKRYTDTCDNYAVNGRCFGCNTGYASRLGIAFEPQECCKQYSVEITDKKILLTYGLAGPGPWYQCKGENGCWRTHPFDPGAKA